MRRGLPTKWPVLGDEYETPEQERADIWYQSVYGNAELNPDFDELKDARVKVNDVEEPF